MPVTRYHHCNKDQKISSTQYSQGIRKRKKETPPSDEVTRTMHRKERAGTMELAILPNKKKKKVGGDERTNENAFGSAHCDADAPPENALWPSSKLLLNSSICLASSKP